MTIDLIVGAIVGLLVTGAIVWALAVLYALVGLFRLAGRGVLWMARRMRRTVPAAGCPACSRDFEHCTCGTPTAPIPRHVPSWAKQGGAQ